MRIAAMFVFVLLAISIQPGPAVSGQNIHGTASLSWSASSQLDSLNAGSGGYRSVYLRLSNVVAVKAINVLIVWTPSGSFDPSLAVSSASGLGGTGLNCNASLRGTLIDITSSSDSTCRLATSASIASSCSTGTFAKFAFGYFDSLTTSAKWRIAYVTTIDEFGSEDSLAIVAGCRFGTPALEPSPVIDHIWPTSLRLVSPSSVLIHGFNFLGTPNIVLSRDGSTTKVGSVSNISQTTWRSDFALAPGDEGYWAVCVQNSGGTATAFSESVFIRTPAPAGGGVSMSGSSAILTLNEGCPRVYGKRRLTPETFHSINPQLAEELNRAGVEYLNSLWPDDLGVPRSTIIRDKVQIKLRDFSLFYEVQFRTPDDLERCSKMFSDSKHVQSCRKVVALEGGGAGQSCPGESSCNYSLPNDPGLTPELDSDGDQWYLHQLESYFGDLGAPGEDSHSPCAWSVAPRSRGTNKIIVGIVDSGIDKDHPDLAHTYSQPGAGKRILIGPNQNFWADGSSGGSEEDDPNDVTDVFGHGTFIAGIIGAKANNGISDPLFLSRGMAGIVGGDANLGADSTSTGVRLLPIKVLDYRNILTSVGSVAAAINAAANKGARVINLSFIFGGGVAPQDIDPVIRDALFNANMLGAVCVAATGNRNELLANYPAAYSSFGLCVAVGGSDYCGRRARAGTPGFPGTVGLIGNEGSTYGPHVDLIAPMTEIYSTLPSYDCSLVPGRYYYDYDSGTSYSAAITSGVAASLLSINPNLDSEDIKALLKATADPTHTDEPEIYVGKGRIDHFAAVSAIDGGPSGGQIVQTGAATSHVLGSPSSQFSLTLRSADNPSVCSGSTCYYLAERYLCTFNVTFPIAFQTGTTPLVWAKPLSSVGWSYCDLFTEHLF